MSDLIPTDPDQLTAVQVAALEQQYREQGFLHLPTGPLEQELDELRALLQSAIQLEHATIPVYLSGLYSLKPEMPWRVGQIIRTVVVEEMLHVVLAANTLNAIGGTPTLTAPDFIPNYPDYLPHHVDDLRVGLLGFSSGFIDQGLAIERPKYVRPQQIMRGLTKGMTIGEFYVLIESKLRSVVRDYGEAAVFTGDPGRQVQPDMFYYDGAGEPVRVFDCDTAVKALQIITDQGEGIEHTIWVEAPAEGQAPEVSHFFRFQELKLGRLYQAGDTYQSGPTGAAIDVPFEAAYRIASNAKLDDYPLHSEVRAHAEAFNQTYCALLRLLERALRGQPELLLQSVPQMYVIRDAAQRLINNPHPSNPELHAAPTFQFAPAS